MVQHRALCEPLRLKCVCIVRGYDLAQCSHCSHSSPRRGFEKLPSTETYDDEKGNAEDRRGNQRASRRGGRFRASYPAGLRSARLEVVERRRVEGSQCRGHPGESGHAHHWSACFVRSLLRRSRARADSRRERRRRADCSPLIRSPRPQGGWRAHLAQGRHVRRDADGKPPIPRRASSPSFRTTPRIRGAMESATGTRSKRRSGVARPAAPLRRPRR